MPPDGVSNEVLSTKITALDRHMTSEIEALRRETLAAQQTAKDAVNVASIESKERLDQHNNVIGRMDTLTKTFATKEAVEHIEAWQARLTGGLVVVAVIGVVNLAKLWFS